MIRLWGRTMQYTVIIEETVSEEFTVNAGSIEEAETTARTLYRSGEFVLEPGNPEEVRFLVSPAANREPPESD